MEIYKQDYFKIFKANFDYEVVETELGDAIKMPARDAFVYSTITGAGYLENPIYPFTPKGLLKLFYNAFDYKFVSGIFDNGVLKNTPYIFSEAKPYLFNGDKYIVPVEFETERELTTFLEEKIKVIKNPENYLIQRIETSKQGNGMEPFMEFVTAEHFKNLGFIVENQVPLAHSLGSPDFAGYGLADAIEKIHSLGFLPAVGFHIIELAMIRISKHPNNDLKGLRNEDLIVGEAKTGTSQMSKQLDKYLATGLFDKGFEIHPSKTSPAKEYTGLVTLDEDYKVRVIPPKETYSVKESFSREDYKNWLLTYIKFYLMANFTNDELKDLFMQKTGSPLNKESDLVEFALSVEIEDLLAEINKI